MSFEYLSSTEATLLDASVHILYCIYILYVLDALGCIAGQDGGGIHNSHIFLISQLKCT